MFDSDNIHETQNDIPGPYSFRITGEVDRRQMKEMSDYMTDVFDRHERVDMLLVFDTDETATAGASLSTEAVEAQAKSLSKVRNYVVANAPGRAGGIVEAMGRLIPVEARSFDTRDEALAWLREQPRLAA